ncbi:MAG: NADP oxidoreductase, partial [Candidatus Omnitrophica bacterium CG12_big_fil_rev_8_21_14_0_65_50_5]
IIGEDICGCYAAGWIKRGASGVIGTNKPDSEETVQSLMEDLLKLQPSSESNAAFENFLKEKNVRFVTFADWQKIDAEEIRRGQVVGKPREKFVNVEDMLKAAGK